MLEAAAIALHLAETGAITARGTLGPLLSPEPPRAVDAAARHVAARDHRARRRT
jgi:hypothetical protein